MKKYIFLFAILCATQAQAQWGGWGRYFVKSGNTISQAVSTDTLSVNNLKLAGGGTVGHVLTLANSAGKITAQTVGAASVDQAGNYSWTGNHLFSNRPLKIASNGADADSFLFDVTNSLGNINVMRYVKDGVARTGIDSNGAIFLYSAAAPVTGTLAGKMAFDSNVWGTSRGGIQLYTGSETAYVPATISTDTPANGDLVTFNTGGTIDWQPPATATVSTKGAWYLPPIQFAVDSAAGIASDTMWVWQNTTGASLTVDSIHVAASSDDYAISIVKANHSGGGGALVDAVTASTNGTNLFYTTETTITSATITALQRVGFVKPASTGDRIYVRIHYH